MSRTIIKSNEIISCFTEKTDSNFSFTRDPDRNRVIGNFAKLAQKTGIDPECFVCGQQTHGTKVGIVTKDHLGSGVTKALHFTETDSLITNVPGIALLTVHADCIPVQLWDPVKKAVATVHSGWKGTLGEIVSETVKAMESAYGTNPSDLIAAIGPGICKDCFEISRDVFECFNEKFPELCKNREFITEGKIVGKWHLNLKKFVYNSLVNFGVKPENIDNTFPCTCCLPEHFYSHRRDSKKVAAGENVELAAMGSLIYIRSKR